MQRDRQQGPTADETVGVSSLQRHQAEGVEDHCRQDKDADHGLRRTARPDKGAVDHKGHQEKVDEGEGLDHPDAERKGHQLLFRVDQGHVVGCRCGKGILAAAKRPVETDAEGFELGGLDAVPMKDKGVGRADGLTDGSRQLRQIARKVVPSNAVGPAVPVLVAAGDAVQTFPPDGNIVDRTLLAPLQGHGHLFSLYALHVDPDNVRRAELSVDAIGLVRHRRKLIGTGSAGRRRKDRQMRSNQRSR